MIVVVRPTFISILTLFAFLKWPAQWMVKHMGAGWQPLRCVHLHRTRLVMVILSTMRCNIASSATSAAVRFKSIIAADDVMNADLG